MGDALTIYLPGVTQKYFQNTIIWRNHIMIKFSLKYKSIDVSLEVSIKSALVIFYLVRHMLENSGMI